MIAIGRLAQDLGELDLATGLYTQAHGQAANRDDLKQIADMLSEAV